MEVWNATKARLLKGRQAIGAAHRASPPRPPSTATIAPSPKNPNFEPTDADVSTAERNLSESQTAKDWLDSRGIKLGIAKKLRLGIRQWPFDENGQPVKLDAIVTPHYSDGTLVGLRMRAITYKTFSQAKGSSANGLYAAEHIDTTKPVLVFEGPEDVALAMSHDFNATGVLNASAKLSDRDLNLLKKCPLIYLIGDMDLAGKQAMDRIEKDLGEEGASGKTIRVRLQGFKDLGEMYNDNKSTFIDRVEYFLKFARASRDSFVLDDLLSEDDIANSQRDLNKYIVDKIIPANTICMFFGEEKSGKSILMAYICKCIRNGVKVFHKFAVVQTPVVYLDMENNKAEITNNTAPFRRLGPELIRFKTRETGVPKLDDPCFLAFCEKFRPVIVLDSLTKFLENADPFHPKDMSDLFDKLLDLCAVGATVIVIHHSTKADTEKYANSHQIGASVRRAFAVVSEDRPMLKRVKLIAKLFRGAEPVSLQLVGYPTIADTGHFGLLASEDPKEAMLDLIREKFPKGCHRSEIQKHFKGCRNEAKTKHIDELLQDGRLVERESGKLFLNATLKSYPQTGIESSNTVPSSSGDGARMESEVSLYI
jgi:archaellum biogenesis ATPase FlaH